MATNYHRPQGQIPFTQYKLILSTLPAADLDQVRADLEARAVALEAAGERGKAELVRGAIAKVDEVGK